MLLGGRGLEEASCAGEELRVQRFSVRRRKAGHEGFVGTTVQGFGEGLLLEWSLGLGIKVVLVSFCYGRVVLSERRGERGVWAGTFPLVRGVELPAKPAGSCA